jgi:hypothetical protein
VVSWWMSANRTVQGEPCRSHQDWELTEQVTSSDRQLDLWLAKLGVKA